MSFFKDFGKDASDLITKDIPTNEQLKVNTTVRNVKLCFTGKTKGNKAEGVLEPTWKHNDYGIEVKANLSSSGNNSVTTSITDKIANGLKLSGSLITGPSQKFESSCEYKYQDKASFTCKTTLPSEPQDILFEESLAVFRNNWSFGTGVDSKFNIEQTALSVSKISAGVQYNGSDYKACFVLNRESKGSVSGKFNYFRTFGKSSVGTCICHNNSTGSSCAALAYSSRCDDGSSKKIVFSSGGKVGLSYKKILDSNTNLIFGCEANTVTKEFQVGLNMTIDM